MKIAPGLQPVTQVLFPRTPSKNTVKTMHPFHKEVHLSNGKTTGCLGYIGEYTTQLCGDYINQYKDPY